MVLPVFSPIRAHGAPMSESARYRAKALEVMACVTADLTPDQRALMVGIADGWTTLADEAALLESRRLKDAKVIRFPG